MMAKLAAQGVISLSMSGLLSLAMQIRAAGLDGFTVGSWLSGWGIGFLLAFPAAQIVVPLALRVQSRLNKGGRP